MTKVEPVADMVVVTKHEMQHSPLYLPGSDDVDSPLWSRLYKVVAVGPGRVSEHGVRIEPDIKPGDIVAFRRAVKDHGSWKDGDDQYVLVEQGKIACRVRAAEAN